LKDLEQKGVGAVEDKGEAAKAAADATASQLEQARTIRAVEAIEQYSDTYVGTAVEPPSLGWIMGITDSEVDIKNIAAIGILLDSGSDEHMCPEEWHDEVDTASSLHPPGTLRDVQGNPIRAGGQRLIKMTLSQKEGGDPLVATSAFTVGPVTQPLLSAGKIVRSGGSIHLARDPAECYMELGGQRTPIEMVGNRFRIVPVRTVGALQDVRLVAPVEGAASSSSSA